MSKLIDPFGHKGPSKVDSISCGVTWVDGRCIFKRDKKWGAFWYGICHYSVRIWAVTPLDYEKPTMITTIPVSPSQHYCEKAFVCLNFKCPFNQFDKQMFINEFSDCGAFSLSLPQTMDTTNHLWFNDAKYPTLWKQLVLRPEGGRVEFNEEAAEVLGI